MTIPDGDDEIARVRRTDERRGRRPIDRETIEERRRMIGALRKILNDGTVDTLREAMREYGLSPDSPEWTETLRIWREERERS